MNRARRILLLRERWCRGFSNLSSRIESPELPDWVSFLAENGNGNDPDADFVLPPDDADTFSFSKNIDADAVSRVLRAPFPSPEAVVRALDGCRLQADASEDLVRKILKRFSHHWISAFGFFNWVDSNSAYSHSRESYDAMVDILGKAKQFQLMWTLLDEMVQVGGGLVALSTMTKVMRRLAGGRRWGEAIQAFHSIERFGVKKDTLAMNIILDTLCKENAVGRARDLFLEIRDSIPPDASSFNALIHGWCKARRFVEARWTMEEMRRFGFEPCVVSYTSMVEAHCLDRNYEEVDLVLNEMEANGCPPNVVTYTIVMHSHGKAKEIPEALMVYDKMKSRGCVPDRLFYDSLIYILAGVGRIRDAYDVYEEMKKYHVKPGVATYNTVISAACAHSQEEKAMEILREMEENSCQPDIFTFAPLLKMNCRPTSMKALQYLLDYMLDKDVSLDLGTYSLLVNRLCKNGCLLQACLFFEEMVTKGFLPRNSTYIMLIEELDRTKLEKVKEKVRRLMAKAHSSVGGGSCQVPDNSGI